MRELDKDNFETEVFEAETPVVLDFWGPQCGPCLALMPEMEKLADRYTGRITFCKVNVAENRRMCIALKVMSVPTILFYKDGECVGRLVGDDVSVDAVEVKADTLV